MAYASRTTVSLISATATATAGTPRAMIGRMGQISFVASKLLAFVLAATAPLANP